MRCATHRRGLSVSWIIAWIAMTALPAANFAADNSDRLTAELAAGEFAPATVTAQAQATPTSRDTALGQVFLAQQQAGALDAAGRSLWQIEQGDQRRRVLSVSGLGGSAQPDFDTLMDLVKGTIAPTTWSDVGGQGAIKPFPGGVLADARGALQRVSLSGVSAELAEARAAALRAGLNRDVRQPSTLRKISLGRLEKELELRRARGESFDEELGTLAGLRRIQYVFIYPDTHDIVLAGPAGDWRLDHERRLVAVESGRPVVRCEDLATLWRVARQGELKFGCSINPTPSGLAQVQAFVADSNKRALRPGERPTWLTKLREQLGPQEVEVFGIPAESRVAQVLVEADYRMKLVGLGLEEGTLGLKNYLDAIEVRAGEAPPTLDVLRWWFTMNYGALTTDADRRVFELRGTGVKVLSENELLAAQGQRVPTGQSEARNRRFAENFTEQFSALAAKYPVYAELQNIFDLALVVALVRQEGLADRAAWQSLTLNDNGLLPVATGIAPRTVDSVINHRVVNNTQIIAVISGGVTVEPESLVKKSAIRVVAAPQRDRAYEYGQPRPVHERRWWWD